MDSLQDWFADLLNDTSSSGDSGARRLLAAPAGWPWDAAAGPLELLRQSRLLPLYGGSQGRLPGGLGETDSNAPSLVLLPAQPGRRLLAGDPPPGAGIDSGSANGTHFYNNNGTVQTHTVPRLKTFHCTGPFLSGGCPAGEVPAISSNAMNQVRDGPCGRVVPAVPCICYCPTISNTVMNQAGHVALLQYHGATGY